MNQTGRALIEGAVKEARDALAMATEAATPAAEAEAAIRAALAALLAAGEVEARQLDLEPPT